MPIVDLLPGKLRDREQLLFDAGLDGAATLVFKEKTGYQAYNRDQKKREYEEFFPQPQFQLTASSGLLTKR